jgi:hypothetical protein
VLVKQWQAGYARYENVDGRHGLQSLRTVVAKTALVARCAMLEQLDSDMLLHGRILQVGTPSFFCGMTVA